MVVGMQKKVLSEIGLYYGDVAMPKGFEIDRDKLQSDILKSQINNKDFPYSREQAVFPTNSVKKNKFWPTVRRIDEAQGDRNLICSCKTIE